MDPPDINAAMDAPSVPVLSSLVNFYKDIYKLNTISNTMTPSDVNNMINTCSVQVASSFPKFSLLPKEIQLKIWFQALPEGKMVYATKHGIFPSSLPHALQDASFDSREMFLKHYKRIGAHTEGCIYARCNKVPVFYSPSEDTIICHADSTRNIGFYIPGNGLLCPELLCCKERRRGFAELRHISILGGRFLYGPSDYVAYRNDAFDKIMMLKDENLSLYGELFATFPMLESFRFVIGSCAVQSRTREVPGKRFVHDSKETISEEIYREKTEEIRIAFEEGRKLHPEVNIPHIEIVCASADILSNFKQPPNTNPYLTHSSFSGYVGQVRRRNLQDIELPS
ncbi:uncharacterized protein EAE97_004160 [Botrytis byssoidea]|uniref:2EXR domain-containing protein n=1 Tax=Botrytis byssoidea TaxID=139641 RepID=A0A9P5IM41_9HELO|nr:uncharacterized protein EAE97_004160 [Botrytis byssoidea]KAF7946911.1 hypothetical protein EAE97_004160 [Botrytis byssoidea]